MQVASIRCAVSIGEILCFVLALTMATVPAWSADMTEPRRPRVIQMNDDSVAYFRWVGEQPKPGHFMTMLDVFDKAGVDTLTHCFHVRWQASYDSKVVEIIGDLTPEVVRPFELTHYWQWVSGIRRLIADGNDPPKVLAAGARDRGMLFMPGLRLNDKHGMHVWEGHSGSFRRDHPDWKLTEPANAAMDYGVPAVREHILKVVAELVERYDVDGIDLDFMRWPEYFKAGEVKANTPVMTEFVRQIRSILDEAGGKKGKRLLLCARVPMRIGEGKVINAHATDKNLECLGIGLDVPTWIREGLIDIVCPMNFFHTHWFEMIRNMPQWRQLTEGSDCGLYPTIHPWPAAKYKTPYVTDASYYGAAYSYYLHGADGIALYNFFLYWPHDDPSPMVRILNDREKLKTMPRRYHSQLGGSVLVGPHDAQLTRKDERKEFEFFLPEDPHAAGVTSTLRFVGRNLTMDHVIEVDVNGKRIDPEAITYEILRRSDGTPDTQYANVVSAPLAGSGAVEGENILGVKWIRGNPEIPFKKATTDGALWGGFTITEVESLFETTEAR